MTDIGYDNIIKRIEETLIEVPPLSMKEVTSWIDGAQYMKNEIIRMLEKMREER